MTTRKPSCCAICENSNLASICAVCVNYRLNEYNTTLKSLKTRRDLLYSKLSEVLVAKDVKLRSLAKKIASGDDKPRFHPGRYMGVQSCSKVEKLLVIVWFLGNHGTASINCQLIKGKADDQLSWRVLQSEKLARFKEKLRLRREQYSQGKAKIEKLSHDLKVKYELLESAMTTLERNRVEKLEKLYPNLICTQSLGHMAITSERLHKQSVVIKQICKLFPQRRLNLDGERKDGSSGQYDQICNARLPRGLDPHSISSEELAASLGYMVQLLNLVVHNVAAPALHNSGFAGSCSRIWQRDSYWDARPSSRSNEYPLFIPRQNSCSSGGDTSWSDRSSSNFGVASMESERKARLDSSRSSSFNYSSASPHSVQTHQDLQKGISLLKKSVACVTAYCYNSLCLDVPSEVSTFEAFAKLLATLSSSKEVRSVFSLKVACSRSSKQVPHLNKSAWNMNSTISSSTLLESAHTLPVTRDSNLPSSAASFLYATEPSDIGKNENLMEGWDLVEHPTFPPPPSQTEDVEHWVRAMIIDATKK